MKNNKVKRIYKYLVNEVDDKEIKELIMCLKDYVYNGSMIDFEIEEEDDKNE